MDHVVGQKDYLLPSQNGFHGIVNQLLGPGLFQRVVQTGIPVKIDKSPCVHLGYDFLVNLPVIAIDAASGKPVKNRLYPGNFQNSPVSFLKIRQIAVPAFVEFLVVMAVAVDTNGVSLQHRTGIFSGRTVVKGEIHGFGIKIQINAFGNTPCQFFLVLRVCQPFSFTGIRQEPRLDQA